MIYQTREERIKAFLETAAECTTDANGYPMTQPAQQYLKELLQAKPKNDHPSILMTFAEGVAHHLIGKQPEHPHCFTTVVNIISDNAVNAGHALDKVGKSIGFIAAPGWHRA